VNKTNCILFFVKYPAAGKVKTRLAKAVGSASASRLYEHFTTDMLDILGGINADIAICFDPSEDKKNIAGGSVKISDILHRRAKT